MNRKEQLLSRFSKLEVGEYSRERAVYIDKDGNYAIIPPGWTVSGIAKENKIWGNNVSLVIYKIPEEKVKSINWENDEDVQYVQKHFDQFVWVPVSFLDANGTLDGGKTFDTKFGRRRYGLSLKEFRNFHEIYGSYCEQVISVNTYGGFYVSRYIIGYSGSSIHDVAQKPFSVRNCAPWIYLNYPNSEQVANSLVEKTEILSSHLISGAEYDSCLEWIIKSGVLTREEVEGKGTKYDVATANEEFKNINYPIKTGTSGEKYSVNNLYEFLGNVMIRTSEFVEGVFPKNEDQAIAMMSHVVRGFPYKFVDSISCREEEWDYSMLCSLGIRACLYINPGINNN